MFLCLFVVAFSLFQLSAYLLLRTTMRLAPARPPPLSGWPERGKPARPSGPKNGCREEAGQSEEPLLPWPITAAGNRDATTEKRLQTWRNKLHVSCLTHIKERIEFDFWRAYFPEAQTARTYMIPNSWDRVLGTMEPYMHTLQN